VLLDATEAEFFVVEYNIEWVEIPYDFLQFYLWLEWDYRGACHNFFHNVFSSSNINILSVDTGYTNH